jgi:hypothetical protein
VSDVLISQRPMIKRSQSKNANARRRCAVCRARKSRCIARHAGACERCVEKGEECDLYMPQVSESPETSSTAILNDLQMSGYTPGSGHKTKNADNPSPLQTAQVRVLGRSVDSDVTLTDTGTPQILFERSPLSTRSGCRARSSETQPPVPSGHSEDAILIVEDIGRTRKSQV